MRVKFQDFKSSFSQEFECDTLLQLDIALDKFLKDMNDKYFNSVAFRFHVYVERTVKEDEIAFDFSPYNS